MNAYTRLIVAAALGAVAQPAFAAVGVVRASSEYTEFYNGDDTKGIDFVQSIRVSQPAYCSLVRGDTRVVFMASGMKQVIARCWQQPTSAKPDPWGHDEVLADLAIGDDGKGEFIFPADKFPNGPTTIRIQARDGKGLQDYCELQVYNLGGIKWKQGIPKEDPPGAAGLKLVYKDDFDGPLSISSNGKGAIYAAHKSGGGDFSSSRWPFTDPLGPYKPFGQRDSYLCIHATKTGDKGVTGILSSIRSDGTGVSVPIPFYMECRFICHSAPGSWGAFWTLTKGNIGMNPESSEYKRLKALGSDELDCIECYGGYGPHNPNHGGRYGATTHFWGQEKDPTLAWSRPKLPNGQKNPNYKAPHIFDDTLKYGGHSSWSWTFHTYGVRADEKDTVYYFDNFEILRHPTGPLTKSQNTWFLINYAIGGISGWPIDMARYNNTSDMWVDWVRVYCGNPEKLPASFGKIPKTGLRGTIGVNFVTDGTDRRQLMATNDVAGVGRTANKGWNNYPVHGGGALIKTDVGKPTQLTVSVGGTYTDEIGEGWGFGAGDAKLKRACLAGSPEVRVANVPYDHYALVVHLGAGRDGAEGVVSVTDDQGEDRGSFAFNYGWSGGAYVESKAKPGETPQGNFIIVRNLHDKALKFKIAKTGGRGFAAVTGFQIIPQKHVR